MPIITCWIVFDTNQFFEVIDNRNIEKHSENEVRITIIYTLYQPNLICFSRIYGEKKNRQRYRTMMFD